MLQSEINQFIEKIDRERRLHKDQCLEASLLDIARAALVEYSVIGVGRDVKSLPYEEYSDILKMPVRT